MAHKDSRGRLNWFQKGVQHIRQDAKQYEFQPGKEGYLLVKSEKKQGFDVSKVSKKKAKVIYKGGKL